MLKLSENLTTAFDTLVPCSRDNESIIYIARSNNIETTIGYNHDQWIEMSAYYNVLACLPY